MLSLCTFPGEGFCFQNSLCHSPFLRDNNLDTLTKFKKAIRKEQSDNTKRIPKHFYYGPKNLNIILTQLRNSYSFLNYDLSKVNIVNDAACSCGAPREDAFHYLFTCPNYTEIRRIMMNNLNWVQI